MAAPVVRGGAGSDSEAEDGPDSTMALPQNYLGRNNRKSEQRAIRLIELGPRLALSLVKIQAELCAGEVRDEFFSFSIAPSQRPGSDGVLNATCC